MTDRIAEMRTPIVGEWRDAPVYRDAGDAITVYVDWADAEWPYRLALPGLSRDTSVRKLYRACDNVLRLTYMDADRPEPDVYAFRLHRAGAPDADPLHQRAPQHVGDSDFVITERRNDRLCFNWRGETHQEYERRRAVELDARQREQVYGDRPYYVTSSDDDDPESPPRKMPTGADHGNSPPLAQFGRICSALQADA
jgi:hypothetical protein